MYLMGSKVFAIDHKNAREDKLFCVLKRITILILTELPEPKLTVLNKFAVSLALC